MFTFSLLMNVVPSSSGSLCRFLKLIFYNFFISDTLSCKCQLDSASQNLKISLLNLLKLQCSASIPLTVLLSRVAFSQTEGTVGITGLPCPLSQDLKKVVSWIVSIFLFVYHGRTFSVLVTPSWLKWASPGQCFLMAHSSCAVLLNFLENNTIKLYLF